MLIAFVGKKQRIILCTWSWSFYVNKRLNQTALRGTGKILVHMVIFAKNNLEKSHQRGTKNVSEIVSIGLLN